MGPLSRNEQACNDPKSQNIVVLTIQPDSSRGFGQSLWIIRQQPLNSVNYKLFLINFGLCLQLPGRLWP